MAEQSGRVLSYPIGAACLRQWTEQQRAGIAAAYEKASRKHGHYESLLAVAAYVLDQCERATCVHGEGEER